MSSPPVVIIAGTASGVGKTSVATGLMAALRHAGHVVQGTKVGPDYVDPGYHAVATGRPARNLDAWLSGADLLVPLLHHGSAGADITVIEGVMGLFDGAHPDSEFASTAHIAKVLDAPILLVVDASAIARSVAAVVHGYATFDPGLRLAGVILNRVGSTGHADLLRTALAPLGVDVIGALPHTEALTTPSRHLGLVPVAERDAEARHTVEELGRWVAAHVDLPAVMALARGARVPATPRWSPAGEESRVSGGGAGGGGAVRPRVRIAVAEGLAFSFRYTENLEVMKAAGADLLPFDPLVDVSLPEGTAAVYLGGGFPEVHGAALAANHPMLASVAAHALAGLPVVAECGGLLYLCRQVDGIDQTGVLPASGRM
ncbi:MAG TPA: cobyrinate a,c-diamide synthase, partial [Euzebya sp.]|nr:cobyrinate a,c-diamide synthase [Euzebya sp.]